MPGNITRQTLFLLPETLTVKLSGPGGPEGGPVPDSAAYILSRWVVSVGCTN